MDKLNSENYVELIQSLKQQINDARIKAHISVNQEMIKLYWRIGKTILERQEQEGWGSKVVENIARDLKNVFPEMRGLSARNLTYMQTFAKAFTDMEFTQQVVAQIPWSHICVTLDKLSTLEQRLWYIQKTLENGWSRNVLTLQIKTNLYEREGKSINNFAVTLPALQSDLAKSIIKDPYNLEFLDLQGKIIERELESKLIDNIRKFLLELGQGFAFIGNQYHIELEGEDYFIDMLFYHVKLKCYVVVELKIGKFKPEYAGKMNFYLNLVDRKVKDSSDNPTIGIILCENKKTITVEYAIEGISRPMGVSEFKITEKLPERLRPYLPSAEKLSHINEVEKEQ